MRTNIHGRDDAIEILKLAESHSESLMLAIYGRRRIGKTFLIDEYFRDEGKYIFLKNVGIKNEPTENQIKIFLSGINQDVDRYNKELKAILYSKQEEDKYKEVPHEKMSEFTWEEFFTFLSKTIDNLQISIKENSLDREVVYFFDEVPFAAEQTSNFANRLAAIWEKYFNGKKKHLFILCGSAASWMIQEIANAKGGLNSRCRHKIQLKPFNYKQMKEYLSKKHHLELSEIDAAKTYMCIGGVAKYLDFFSDKKGLMFSQSITNLMFSEFKEMRSEFDLLMESIFENAAVHKSIIQFLASKEKGVSEAGLIQHLDEMGHKKEEAKRCLKELVDCDYLLEMTLIRPSGEEQVYRLIDEYCRFFFKWIYNRGEENFQEKSNYWNNEAHTSKIWFGTSFEAFCFRNKDSITNLLQLSRFITNFFSYSINTKGGAEGDVVIEASVAKKIHGVFIIENKFKEGTQYSIDEGELKILINKIKVLKEVKKYDIDPAIIFITSDGVIKNENLKKLGSASYTIADL